MPDGSRHAAYHNISGSDFITKDYWIVDADANPPFVTLTNSTQIYYGQSGPPHPDYPNQLLQMCNGITVEIRSTKNIPLGVRGDKEGGTVGQTCPAITLQHCLGRHLESD